MRVALISDIHGNLVALETVLADLAGQAVDRIVCLGDVAATGPQPHEAIERLRALNCPVVMGNTDEWLITARPATAASDEIHQAIDRWCREQLTAADLDFLRTFAPTIEVALDDKTALLCVHGSPRSNTEAIETTTPDDALAPMLSNTAALVIASGHTHVQMLRRYNGQIVINPGSVGLPYEILGASDEIRNPPWAEYAILSWHGQRLGIELRRVPLDIRAVTRAALESGMPYVEAWVRDWR
ncbi:MAG TPA: metallophosphoesterase family protein [Herpetosiphonaceae bacterium]